MTAPWQAAEQPPEPPAAVSLQAWIRQLVACALVFLLSALLPEHLAALAAALTHPGREPPQAAAIALALVGLDAFGLLCALYLSHTRLRGARMLRCYPPRRLIPLSLHVLGL